MNYTSVLKAKQDRMGGLKSPIYLAPRDWFDSLKPVVAIPDTPDATYADEAARLAATPATGEVALQSDTGAHWFYDGANWIAVNGIAILETHTFLTGKGFVQLTTTQDTGKLMAEMIGERDGRGKRITVEAFHPGTAEEAEAFFRQAKNDEWIALVVTPNGLVVQVGTDGLEAEVVSAFDSGTISSGRNGHTITVSAFSNHLVFYKGAITPKP